MKNNLRFTIFCLTGLLLTILSCQKGDEVSQGTMLEDFAQTNYSYFEVDALPSHFSDHDYRITRSGSSGVVAGTDQETKANANEIVTLGRVLFYDNKLSLNGAISCASCHHQDKAFCDGEAVSEGLFNELTTRNSMSLTNLGFQSRFFWDVKTRNLVDAVMMPVENHVEMGIRELATLPDRLNNFDYYADLVQDAYGTEVLTEQRISEALAMFVASMSSYRSKFDKGQETDFANFTESELRGQTVFNQKGLCFDCHKGTQLTAVWRGVTSIGLEPDEETGEFVAAKVPSLRNIEVTGPYMHDGRFETLEEVVEHYNSGVVWHEELDWTLRNGSDPVRLNLTDEEKADLVAYLKTFTDHDFLNDPRFSNPFR